MMSARKNFIQQKLCVCMLACLPLIAWRDAAAVPATAGDKSHLCAGRQQEQDSTVYQTGHLIIRKLSPHVYVHISYLQTNSFGKVDCNGMIVINRQEAIIFDTPANDTASTELIQYLVKQGCRIKAVIATHFHEDCIGGLASFNNYNIPAYASNQTIALLKNKGDSAYKLLKGFAGSLELEAGHQIIYAKFTGEGHTKDNIIGYYPEDKAMFGGCLIKAEGATKGFLGDANTAAWPATVTRVKQQYPGVKIVIPGHGKTGGPALLDYTIGLFKQ